jgi:hypothetical protein
MPSRRDLIKMSAAEVAAFLGGRRTLNLASFGPDGNIHLVAMWYGFLPPDNTFDPTIGFGDGRIVVETFAKSQKVQNLRRDRRFSAIVEDGSQYSELRGVEMVGNAEILEEPRVVVESCKAVLSRYESIAKPEDLQAAAEFAANKRVCIALNVERIVTWDHTKLDVPY